MQRVHITEYHQRGAERFERVDNTPGRFYEEYPPATLLGIEVAAWAVIVLFALWCSAGAVT